MKKLTTIAFFAIILLQTETFAQKIGVKGGFNLSTLALNYTDASLEGENNFRPGFHFGVTSEFELTGQISLRPSVLFTTKGYNTDLEETFAAAENFDGFDRHLYNYIEVPVNVYYDFGGIQVFAGPYVALGIGGTNTFEYTVEGGGLSLTADGESSLKPTFGETAPSEIADDEIPYRGIDAGLNVGVGYRTGPVLLDVGFQLGLANVAPNIEGFDASDFTSQNRVIYLSLSYFIN
jgi:hypothetical protein